MCACMLSRVPLLATPWTVAHQAPPWEFPCKNTGVPSHFLLWGSSQPRDWTCISCISRRIYYCTTVPPGKPMVKDSAELFSKGIGTVKELKNFMKMRHSISVYPLGFFTLLLYIKHAHLYLSMSKISFSYTVILEFQDLMIFILFSSVFSSSGNQETK